MDRRTFLKQGAVGSGSLFLSQNILKTMSGHINILNPRNRIPVNFIIDDSTALVNLAHYGIPQFKEVFPKKYLQNWRELPREIPDSFVRKFIGWCDDHGVKGKYSMVPYPACTGWLHRFIPGWTKKELEGSLALVRDIVTPNWDIHSEMISHTRVIDIKTGLPYPDASPDFMENWEWSQTKSADELGEYIAYSLHILKEAGFNCDGVTTPGGFGHRNIPNLALGTKYAVQEVYGHQVAHFFRDVVLEASESVQPEVMHASNLDSDQASCSVHIKACTGDWCGGWDGLTPGDADKYITEDGAAGRLPEVIAKGEPAIFICHWPGIYYNGEELGFNVFKEVVTRLHHHFDNLFWMKLTDIADYWAAKEHTQIRFEGSKIVLRSPFACRDFTFSTRSNLISPFVKQGKNTDKLVHVSGPTLLKRNSWTREGDAQIFCVDLAEKEVIISD